MRKKLRIAVMASGQGTTFEALVDAGESGALPAEVCLFVTDDTTCRALARARALDVPTCVQDYSRFTLRLAMEEAMVKGMRPHAPDLVVLAGYMRKVGQPMLDAYPKRIINLHPSLLPAFPGKDALGQALQHGVKVTGATVHFIDEGLDTGPIIAQEAVAVPERCTEEELRDVVRPAEVAALSRAIRFIAEDRVSVLGRRVDIQTNQGEK